MTHIPALLAAVALLTATACADTPSFTLDVVPILSKAGCNTGGCHGALAGKGGFRLSLFGYDPHADHLAITREALGRRVDSADPGASLLLTKPTMAVAHKGGLRLDTASADYALLAKWISAGCPGPSPEEKTLVGVEVTPAERGVCTPFRHRPLLRRILARRHALVAVCLHRRVGRHDRSGGRR